MNILIPLLIIRLLFNKFLVAERSLSLNQLEQRSMIHYINNKVNNSWIAGKVFGFQYENGLASQWNSMKPYLFSEISGSSIKHFPKYFPSKSADNLPDNFDSRDMWSFCKTIREIRAQSNCGSCWAVSSAEIMSDRICIHSKGKLQPRLSALDILSCCKYPICKYSKGCNTGYPIEALKYFINQGVVTGGPFGSHSGCQDYPFRICGHGKYDPYKPCKGHRKTPICKETCQPGYNKTFNNDKYYGKSAYHIDNNEQLIRQEIYRNGPVVACFKVYNDFYSYRSGIYQYVTGRFKTSHCVKVLGWGVSLNGLKYWLSANSWNPYWGDKGFFKILRGVNECDFEKYVVAGMPRLI